MTILKKEHGNTNQSIKEQVSGNSYHTPDDKKTEQKIAERCNVSPKTVRNAEKFADAVNKVAENTGIDPQKILAEEATQKEIKKVAAFEPEKEHIGALKRLRFSPSRTVFIVFVE